MYSIIANGASISHAFTPKGRRRAECNSMSIAEEILNILVRARSPVSGEAMARELNVSRTAVWKGIGRLKERGFQVEARPGVGYVVTGYPDKLLPELIQAELDTEIVGSNVLCFDVVDSTNSQAKSRASAGMVEGTVLTAEEQTKGKGRIDRAWVSPRGENLLFSIILRPRLLPTQVFRLNMVASVSLVEAIEELTPLRPLIKWPNDVYINNRKLAGMLTEFSGAADGIEYAIVGIGLNVNFDPSAYPTISQPATSVRRELGKPVSRLELLRAFLKRFDYHYLRLKRGLDSDMRDLWNSRSMVIGKDVTITSFDQVEHAKALSVDEDGALIIENQKGERKRVICGDVSLRLSKPGQ